jgi:hypothetical protein
MSEETVANAVEPRQQEVPSRAPRILQINYALSGTASEYMEENKPYAEPIAETPGLLWKIWLLNEATREAGGIYLFESDAALKGFVNGPIGTEISGDPTSTFKEFDVPAELSAVTRAPIS